MSHGETSLSPPQLVNKARVSDLSPTLFAPVLNCLEQWPFKSLVSIRALVSREYRVILLPSSASTCVQTGDRVSCSTVLGIGICPYSLASVSIPPTSSHHLPPTRPVSLVLAPLPGPSLFGHGSEPRLLIGSGRHARVCQQRGVPERSARQPAQGGGPTRLECACLWVAILPAAWRRRCG